MNLHLVTGGTGFLGSVLVEELKKNQQSVRVIDLNSPLRPVAGVDYQQGSILNDSDLAKAMVGVTHVHHAAALVPLHRKKKDFDQTNLLGTQKTFVAAKKSGVQHFCQISSSAVYGLVSSMDCPLKNDHPGRPFEAYGKSKLAADEFLLEAQKQSDSPKCAILRPRTVIGPGRLGVLQLLFEWIRLGCHVYLPGSGHNKFQLLDVRDLASASWLAAKNNQQGVFLLGAQQFASLREDLSALCEHANTGSQVRQIPSVMLSLARLSYKLGVSPINDWHINAAQHDLYFDLSVAHDKLGWVSRYSNQQMLIEAFDWYLQNRLALQAQSQSSVHQRPLDWGILALTKMGRK